MVFCGDLGFLCLGPSPARTQSRSCKSSAAQGSATPFPLVVIGLIILDRRGVLQDKALRMLSDKQAKPRHCLRPLLPTFLALACRQVLACGSMAFLPSSRDRVIGELAQFIFRTNERSER